ncbi:MAG: fused MFS/spermidine synthase, partial [Dehalococcoidia bacterium]|nr:fused MFS/spermidine synthase [Dehalococcoidia bacterium]
LAAIALSFFIAEKGHIVKSAITSALIFIMIFVPFLNAVAFWDNSILYEGESVYNYLQISEDEDNYYFRTNVAVGVQSVKNKNGNNDGWYYSMAIAAPLLAGITPVASPDYTEQINKDKKVLILGLAMGTYCELVYSYFGTDVEIIGVEIDKKIVDLARGEYFALSENVKAVVTDGRAFLAYNNSEKYDVIIVDAYQDITIPFYMCTSEFFTLVREHLTDDGIMVINLNMRADQEGNINDYLIDTVSKSFDSGRIYKVDVPGTFNSLFYIAKSGENLKEKLQYELSGFGVVPGIARFRDIESRMSECMPKNKYFFTDDKAPVELIGAGVIDELISDGIGEFRQILQEKGFWGLIEYLK